MHDNLVHVRPNRGRLYAVKLDGLGLVITAGLDDDGQPYISVNTEEMAPEHTYDETTGLRGDTRPYEVRESERGDGYIVSAPAGGSKGGRIDVAHHLPQPTNASARLAAKQHVDMLNDLWSTVCGMPIISVHLGDAELYDARDHNPALRKTEEKTNA